jgi:uncharacterized protein (TIGR03437 family)
MTLKITALRGLVLAAVTLLSSPLGRAQNVTYTYTYVGAPLPIFKDSADVISIADIYVPRAIRITKVTANVEIDYPRPGDLNVFMYSPILTRARLLERNCGSNGSLANVTFDDAAPTRFSDVCPTAAGTYRGNEPLSNFNNQTAIGIWTLAVENNGSNDFVGYLRGFSLTFTGAAVTDKPVTVSNAVRNAAGFQSAVVAPGEVVNIQGFNMGPALAVTAPPGNLPTTLGGVQVTFGGTPAAVSYVSPFLVQVQVPFSVTAGAQTEMRVVNAGATSDPVMLNVLNAVPGVYTIAPNGKGPVTAVNQDGSLNSQARPAGKGQIVTIYAAGLGSLNPPLTTGQAPPLSQLSNTTWPVTAVIDGITAPVTFAGGAPGYPGLYQVNVMVPATAASGTRSLTLFGAGAPSQSELTIFVQ